MKLLKSKVIKGFALILSLVCLLSALSISVSAKEANYSSAFQRELKKVYPIGNTTYGMSENGTFENNGVLDSFFTYTVMREFYNNKNYEVSQGKWSVPLSDFMDAAKKYFDIEKDIDKYTKMLKDNTTYYDSATETVNFDENNLLDGGGGPTPLINGYKKDGNVYTAYVYICIADAGYPKFDEKNNCFIVDEEFFGKSLSADGKFVLGRDYVYSRLFADESYESYEFCVELERGTKPSQKEMDFVNKYGDVAMIFPNEFYQVKFVFDGVKYKFLSSDKIDKMPQDEDLILRGTGDIDVNIGGDSGVKDINTFAFIDGTKVAVAAVKDKATVNTALKALDKIMSGDKISVVSFKAIYNNQEIQPDGKVKVTFEIPNGYAANKVAVYYVSDDGKTVEKIETKLSNDKKSIIAELAHFSNYAIIETGGSPKTNVNDSYYALIFICSIVLLTVTSVFAICKKRGVKNADR